MGGGRERERERERVCVCEREREWETERESVRNGCSPGYPLHSSHSWRPFQGYVLVQSSLILADPAHCLDPRRTRAAMDQEKFVINWMVCTWISFSSMSNSLHGPNTGGFSAKKRYHSTCITSQYFPYHHQVSAVLLADGWEGVPDTTTDDERPW